MSMNLLSGISSVSRFYIEKLSIAKRYYSLIIYFALHVRPQEMQQNKKINEIWKSFSVSWLICYRKNAIKLSLKRKSIKRNENK